MINRIGGDRIFVVEDDGRPELDLTDDYPTVWHYLLEVAENTRLPKT